MPRINSAYGSDVLHGVRVFMKAGLYVTDEQLDTLVLANAVTHVRDAVTAVGHILATSDFPQSGKTTVLDYAMMLSENGWMVKPTQYALNAKYIEAHSQNKPVTPCLDEISKIFGESGLNGRQNPVYELAVISYRKNAKISISVNRVAVDISCYGTMFMSGLKTAAPPDLRGRSIIIEMVPAPDSVKLEDALDPSVEAIGLEYGKQLHAWAASHKEEIRQFARNGVRRIHPKLRKRLRQIWGPLFAVAHIAGGDWPERCLNAFLALALDGSDKPVLNPLQQILLDTADVIAERGVEKIFTADLVPALQDIPDRQLYDILSEEKFVQLLSEALGPSRTIRGYNFVGQYGRAKGRDARLILAKAGQLRQDLTPEPEEDPEADAVDEELSFHSEKLPPARGTVVTRDSETAGEEASGTRVTGGTGSGAETALARPAASSRRPGTGARTGRPGGQLTARNAHAKEKVR